MFSFVSRRGKTFLKHRKPFLKHRDTEGTERVGKKERKQEGGEEAGRRGGS